MTATVPACSAGRTRGVTFRWRLLPVIVLLWCACLPPRTATAVDPAAPIRSIETALRDIQSQGGTFNFSAIERAVATSLDLAAMVDTLLGAAAGRASAAQRARLGDVVIARLTRELNRLQVRWSEGDLKVLRSRAVGKAEWLVTTSATRPDGRTVVLNWRVRAGRNGLRVVDVLRDGASALARFRRELAIAVQRDDLDVVIAKLEQRYGVPGR